MSRPHSCTVTSPVGGLKVVTQDGAITALNWAGRNAGATTPGSNLLAEAAGQLDAYFAGDLKSFDLPLAPAGTDFQKGVWREMLAIPYGETRTYGEVAKSLTSAAQAVGNACGANPIPVIIPCHRILASAGPGGYSGAGGLETKRKLLDLEGYQPAQGQLFA